MLNALDAKAGLWEARTELALPGWAWLPLRMTVLRLPDGALLLHSPIALDDALAAELAALGPVRHLVAPNLFHHLYLRPARERFPQARLHAPRGLAAKRPRLSFDAVLEPGLPAEWGGAVEVLPLAGISRAEETLLLHRPSGTLICGDLVFNVQRWHGALTGLMLHTMGTAGRLAGSRMLHLLVRDRAAFRASLLALRERDFQRIVMGHGEVHESPSARDDLLAALELRLGPGLRGPSAG
jgi:glyoxylase-like metal-dependent hydrolase (beta-lactamase superfamily II)